MSDQNILDAVNQYGGPFKKGVMHVLASIPGMSIVAEEYPAGLGDDRTAIDIVASFTRDDCICYLTIECKRALAAYKKWVFFKETAADFFKIGRGISKSTMLTAGFISNGLLDIEMCSDGCEIKEENSNKESRFKASGDPIYKAAAQAALGYLSFLQERSPPAPLINQTIPHRRIIVLPLIVTSAELFTSKKDGSIVDMNTGLCRLEALHPVPWVGYRFPCHPASNDPNVDRRIIHLMQSYVSACMGMDESTADTYKETLYIVQANQLRTFLQNTIFVILNEITRVLNLLPSHPAEPKRDPPRVT